MQFLYDGLAFLSILFFWGIIYQFFKPGGIWGTILYFMSNIKIPGWIRWILLIPFLICVLLITQELFEVVAVGIEKIVPTNTLSIDLFNHLIITPFYLTMAILSVSLPGAIAPKFKTSITTLFALFALLSHIIFPYFILGYGLGILDYFAIVGNLGGAYWGWRMVRVEIVEKTEQIT